MSICIVAEGSRFDGNLQNFSGDIQIDGRVYGSIHSLNSVFVSKQGCIYSDVHAEQVVVNGKVLGNIYASKIVRLLKDAVVMGDIYAVEMETEPGCCINGSSKIFLPGEEMGSV